MERRRESGAAKLPPPPPSSLTMDSIASVNHRTKFFPNDKLGTKQQSGVNCWDLSAFTAHRFVNCHSHLTRDNSKITIFCRFQSKPQIVHNTDFKHFLGLTHLEVSTDLSQ